MHTDQEDNFGSEDNMPLVGRRNFLRGVAATAAVATVGGPAALVTPALAQEGWRRDRGWGRDRVPRDQISIQLFTLRDQLAIDFAGTIASAPCDRLQAGRARRFCRPDRRGVQGGAGRQ